MGQRGLACMNVWISLGIFVVALILVIKASDVFLDSAIWIARRYRIPEVIIGATLVSICTTLPETVISASSSMHGMSAMALGNAAGSILFNGGVILGLVLLIAHPRIRSRETLLFNLLYMVGCLVMVIAFLLGFGVISRVCGILLLIALIVYLLANLRMARSGGSSASTLALVSAAAESSSLPKQALLLVLGAGGTVIGANLMVEHGAMIARAMDVSEMAIGMTMTGIGSSLPELATAITAIRKNTPDISVGNIVGANLLNVLLVIGASAVICPIDLPLESTLFHLGSALALTMLLLLFVLRKQGAFKRLDGFLLMALYAAYMIISLLRFD